MEENTIYLGKWISIIYRQSQIYFNHHMKSINVTSAEYFYILALNAQDGISQEALCTQLSVDKAGATRVIQSLESKGFVKREKDTHDKRMNLVYLTPAGKQTYLGIKKVIAQWNQLLTENMSHEQSENLAKQLETIVKQNIQKETLHE